MQYVAASPPDQDVSCSGCGKFLAATNAPWGRVKAYCRGCRKFRYGYLGKPPEEDQHSTLTEQAA